MVVDYSRSTSPKTYSRSTPDGKPVFGGERGSKCLLLPGVASFVVFYKGRQMYQKRDYKKKCILYL